MAHAKDDSTDSGDTMSDKPAEKKKRPGAGLGDTPPSEYAFYLDHAVVAFRTVRLVVMAGFASFIVLAIFGFYLIYQLTGDAHRLVEEVASMNEQMQVVSEKMVAIDQSVGSMQTTLDQMNVTMAGLSVSMTEMDASLIDIKQVMISVDQNFAHMDLTMAQMASAVTFMQHSTRNLDANISQPLSFFNSMMPYGMGPQTYGGPPPYALPPPR